ncbi:Rieske (2Fe-2S) protein [Jiangella alkaliphila]|uniref:Ferredoxin subunit of nitrite reductase or a ring-hydroxylating dioxygenase n=1 Tax=Jiangella alkaliphila TaxID=419479 RepID=A0A1H2J6E8_9ACTN|nr:Rieske (2Fe-2S) protein [Jiangella alkaliphila]SDU51745.1 Ferredoxin subunit of nitrite reductase or a ring-hydroxylating dioxygenase [Jiangella alkaliphila]
MTAGTPRRQVLVLGAAGVVTAATGCTVYGDENDPPDPPDSPDSPDQPDASDGGGASGGGAVVATTGDVEVGGGLILAEQQVVITQPAEGDFRAFSAVCTHQGCTVSSVGDGTIDCACHGSRFSIEDGSVVQAASGLSPDDQDPLPPVDVTVDGDQISLASG